LPGETQENSGNFTVADLRVEISNSGLLNVKQKL
jgi:hypothetical protein